MRLAAFVLLSIAVAAGTALPVMGQTFGHDSGPIKPGPVGDFDPDPGLPNPGEPDPAEPVAPTIAGFQLVGFTTTEFAGNRGLLNMTLGCQTSIPGSRVCTVSEILRTVNVPELDSNLMYGRAWVISEGAPVALVESALVSDCRGWASGSDEHLGLALDLGPSEGCYGGLIPTGCDERLAVACCASPESWVD